MQKYSVYSNICTQTPHDIASPSRRRPSLSPPDGQSPVVSPRQSRHSIPSYRPPRWPSYDLRRPSLTPDRRPRQRRPSLTPDLQQPSLTFSDIQHRAPGFSRHSSLNLGVGYRLSLEPLQEGGGGGSSAAPVLSGLTRDEEHELRMGIVNLEGDLDAAQSLLAEKEDVISKLSEL